MPFRDLVAGTGKVSVQGLNFHIGSLDDDKSQSEWSGTLTNGEFVGSYTTATLSGKFRIVRIAPISIEEVMRYEGVYETDNNQFVVFAASAIKEGSGRLHMLNFGDGMDRMLLPLSTNKFSFGPGRFLPYPVQGSLKFTHSSVGNSFVLKKGFQEVKRGSQIKFNEQDIGFANGAVKLSGRIIFPRSKGPYPAVVIVHGGGPESAEDALMVSRWFAWQGIAALAYDKRGVGRSTGDWRTSNLHELAGDVLAAVRYLQGIPEINTKQIGTWGFSQAGWIMSIAAAVSGDIAFVMPVVPSGVAMDQQEMYSRGNELRYLGFSASDVHAATKLMRKTFAVIRTTFGEETLLTELKRAKSKAWFHATDFPVTMFEALSAASRSALREAISFDALPLWANLRVPALVIFGEYDQTVPSKLSAPAIESALKQSGNKDVTVRMFPKATHAMFEINGNLAQDEARSPGYPTDFWSSMSQWLLKRVHIAK